MICLRLPGTVRLAAGDQRRVGFGGEAPERLNTLVVSAASP
jgi:hypothetical protein